MAESFDAVVVGARCAGATLALGLARAGWRVALVDRYRFPNDTATTHVIFPNTLARLDQLGVLKRLQAEREIPLLRFSFCALGHEVAGGFTAIDGHDRASCVRRCVLDPTMLSAALESGAESYLGRPLTSLLGDGSDDDPVRGVVLESGEELSARWVFGADGRVSTVARAVGAVPSRQLRGEQSLLFAYWRGIPRSEWLRIVLVADQGLMSTPCEDGVHLLVLAGDPSLAQGNGADREASYAAGIRGFPDVLPPPWLERAERVSELFVAPEAMMRGHFRRASGPGWALVGDAGHLAHPAGAQGISDAIEHALYIADAVSGCDSNLDGYAAWRDDRAAEFYEWSFDVGRWPVEHRAGPVFAGLAEDRIAGQEWRDIWSRRRRPSEVLSWVRTTRWSAARAYGDARVRLGSLLSGVQPARFDAEVPACPGWTVRDVLAHLVGVATDWNADQIVAGLADSWADEDAAAARDAWTNHHVQVGRQRGLGSLLAAWARSSAAVEKRLRSGDGLPAEPSPEVLLTPTADLAVHVQDVRHALDVPGDRDSAATRLAFSVYLAWLGMRLIASELPALTMSDGHRHWVAGAGDSIATVTADRFDLFRAISGRRSADQIRAMAWDGDPDPFIDFVSPYRLPDRALIE